MLRFKLKERVAAREFKEGRRISLSIRQAAEDEFSFDDEAMGEEAPADAEEAPVQE